MSDVGASLRRRWPLALLVVLLTPVAVLVYLAGRDTERPPARYSTSADILIPAREEETGTAPADVPPVLLQGQIELALSRNIQDVTLRAVGLDPAAQNRITFLASLSEKQTIITLTASAPSPELAAKVLDEYIIAYEDGRRQSVLDAAVDRQDVQFRTIRVLDRKIANVENAIRYLGFELIETVPDGDPVPAVAGASNDAILLYYERNALLNEKVRRQVDYSLQATQAAIPGQFAITVQRRSASRIAPPPPSPLVPLIQILIGGWLLAIALPVLVDRFDATITEGRAAPRILRSGLLATIPFMPRRLHHQLVPPGSVWDMAFRSLAATSISTDRLPKAIVVTAPTGTTQDTVAANFAAGLASLGLRVALIATVPRQEWFLHGTSEEEPHADDATETGGTTTTKTATTTATSFPALLAAAGSGRLVGDVKPLLATNAITNLYVVPPPTDDTELSMDGLPPLLDALSRSEIDITVIAGPALLEEPSATIMAWSTRHVLWAIELGRVNTRDASLAADRLELAGVTPFGVALVARNALRS